MSVQMSIDLRQCAVCGNLFKPSTIRQICCSPVCFHARNKAMTSERRRQKKTNNKVAEDSYKPLEESPDTIITCKCPKCEVLHQIKTGYVRQGFVPRVYCKECRVWMLDHGD